MTGIPILMGHKPAVCIDKLCVTLQKIHATTMRLGPSFVLLLRILIAYVIAGPDYVVAVVPVQLAWVCKAQNLIKRVACAALKLPPKVPKALIYTPLSGRGFGLPTLYLRFQMKFLLT